ncbi:iron ABC transporter substrate-binding protein [Methanococcoides sp. AM1]|uniref:iron ABC transporter substrate-binding protein n=1 Tax=Methanococcoides sp. AM1 TaxID=1201011 RepID=UPI00108329B8|nr:iron ABC transporter substrate-binding protein [Methanococcoides sp. AM1]
MKLKTYSGILIILLVILSCIGSGCVSSSGKSAVNNVEMQTITDGLGREVTVPVAPEKIICQGPGALRYICYLGAQDKVVGVEDIELRKDENRRPYAIANPQFQNMPLIGEYRGNTDPEKIVAVDPDVIFWTYVQSADDADELQAKTGIPVIALNYGDLGVYRDDMYHSLRIMAEVMEKEERGEEVIEFFDMTIEDLGSRTEDIPEEEKASVYVGGIAYRGPHGFQSTEPSYPPFELINAKNVASSLGTEHADVSKEAIIEWDPEIIFVDLSTYQTTPSAVDELKTDPAYTSLTAVKNGEVYGVVPYNWYTTNHGSVLAAAYYSGEVIYPDRFQNIDAAEKADEIYVFLFGEPAYEAMNSGFSAGFGQIELNE